MSGLFSALPAKIGLVSAADLSQFSPPFSDWAGERLADGSLNVLVKTLLQNGLAANPKDALDLLFTQSKGIKEKDVILTCLDRRGQNHSNPWQKILSATDSPELSGPTGRIFGTWGHHLIRLFLSGEWKPKTRVSSQLEIPLLSLYPWIFSPAKDAKLRQGELFDRKSFQESSRLRECLLKGEIALDNFLTSVELVRNYAQRVLASVAMPLTARDVLCLRGIQKDLRELLAVFCGEQLYLATSNQNPNIYLTVAGLVSMANGLLWAAGTELPPPFTEINVFHPQSYGLSAGRMDALWITGVNGRGLNPSQKRILSGLSRQRLPSAVKALLLAEKILGPKLEIRTADFKFGVGDHPHPLGILTARDTAERPLPSHVRQTGEYHTLVSVGHDVVAARGEWEKRAVLQNGSIVYLVPDFPVPLKHEVRTAPHQQREIFGILDMQGPNVLRRAFDRCFDNLLAQWLKRSFLPSPQVGSGPGRRKKAERDGVTDLFPQAMMIDPRQTLQALSEELGKEGFVDPVLKDVKIFTGPDGKQRCFIHYGNFLDAVRSGARVVGRGFSALAGGKAKCLNPGHKDAHPSMQIYPLEGSAFCFSCKTNFAFLPGSIPADLRKIMLPAKIRTAGRSRARQGAGLTETETHISERHCLIMQHAQGTLNRGFLQSPGAKYLREQRGLDPDLADQYEAGFGTVNLISELLESGWELDDLLFYGFLAISNRVGDQGEISRILRSRGLKNPEIRRPVPSEKSPTGETWGFPYCPLNNRLTFPLGGRDGTIDSIYGRATGKFGLKHYKLRIADGFQHGGGNMAALNSDCQEVLVVEAALDGLTIIQALKLRNVVWVIGLGNWRVMDEIIRSGKKIALALDFDKGGRDETPRLLKKLEEAGVLPENLRDFTGQFLSEHPEAAVFDDYNSWWQNRI